MILYLDQPFQKRVVIRSAIHSLSVTDGNIYSYMSVCPQHSTTLSNQAQASVLTALARAGIEVWPHCFVGSSPQPEQGGATNIVQHGLEQLKVMLRQALTSILANLPGLPMRFIDHISTLEILASEHALLSWTT